MTSTVRNAMNLMKRYAPYDGNQYADEETYNEIYNAVHVLCNLDVIPRNEFDKLVKLDNKLFLNN